MTAPPDELSRTRRPARSIVPLAMCAALLAAHAGGCAALPAATIGTLVGITASAVSTGRDVYRAGKLDAAELAGLDDATAAARGAAVDLGLEPKPDAPPPKDDTIELRFADEKGTAVKARIERRTATLVRIRIDVGLFGSEATARLFLSRLRAHLPPGPSPPPPAEAEVEEGV